MLFSHFILLGLSLLFSVMSIAKDHIKNTDIAIPKIDQQEIDLVYYKVFPAHKFLRNTDIVDCTVKPETVSLRQKNHHSVLICKEKVNLLRDKKTVSLWQKENRLHGFILLDMPEIGLCHVKAHVVVVKNTSKFSDKNIKYLNGSNINPADIMRPVTGVFIRHVANVRQYLLKNIRTGRISAVNVTPGHRFYVSNRQAFIPIGKVSISDELITDTGDEVRIIADSKGGLQKNNSDKTEYDGTLKRVYNLEVSKKHIYFVSDLHVLVHNQYVICMGPNGKLKFNGTVDGKYSYGKFNDMEGKLIYKGRMKSWLADGFGIEYDEYEREIYRGSWIGGKRNGYGESFSYDIVSGECSGYAGFWENNRFHGEGFIFSPVGKDGVDRMEMHGRFEEGSMVYGTIHEKLLIPEERRLRYRGGVKNGKHDGEGIGFKYKGDRCQGYVTGSWVEGKLWDGEDYSVKNGVGIIYSKGERVGVSIY